MNGYLFPEDYFIPEYGLKNFFENTVATNFNHRWLASVTFIIIISFAFYLYFFKKKYNKSLIFLIVILVCIQFILGILTLLTNVKIILASMHQINSILLLGSILLIYYSIKKQRGI